MRKILILLSLLFFSQGHAQTLMGLKAGSVSSAVSSYQGPIDINGTAWAFWSTRCGSTSYTGNVIDIVDTSTGLTHTTITCSSGGILNTNSPNALATTCAVSCSAKTVYDQSGSNHCGGSACDMTQTTLANMPLVTTNCQNSKICMVFNRSGPSFLAMPTTSDNLPQPIMASFTLNCTDGSGTTNDALGSNPDTEFYHITDNANMYALGAGNTTATANHNVLHAIQDLLNGVSSAFYIDGVLTSPGIDPGSAGIGNNNALNIGSLNGTSSHAFTGKIFEVGVWPSDKSANNSTMNSNSHTYWSF